jgi:hypothetical protein
LDGIPGTGRPGIRLAILLAVCPDIPDSQVCEMDLRQTLADYTNLPFHLSIFFLSLFWSWPEFV